ncbi:transposase family protein [uncultured Actinomyces sp.]|uniref:transposase family protein n=1 Tax=uncultured Actinomyces sp. TaxID=249061 RepID=UPI0028EA4458|nr:transposase family protein [uncultured Actinomyces sp.]
MSVARTPGALVLDVESCNQLVGCPGCGVIAQGHGRVVVEVIDAPWAGVPVRIRWFKRRWICRETTCQIATFSEQNHSMCAPRARLGVRAIRWAIRQLRFEGATILGLARQLGTTWNTVWSHIKPCLQAASDDPARFAGVRVLGVDERRVASPGPTPPGPTRVHRHRGPDTREGTSHGKVVGPGPRQVWHRVQELARRARRRLPCGGANRDAGSLPGTARTPSMTNSRTQPHQLQTPNAPHDHRSRRVHPHPPVKSRKSGLHHHQQPVSIPAVARESIHSASNRSPEQLRSDHSHGVCESLE